MHVTSSCEVIRHTGCTYSLCVQAVCTVTFEVHSDVVEEKLDEWLQVVDILYKWLCTEMVTGLVNHTHSL